MLGKTVFRPFEDTKKFVRNLKLKNYVEWKKYQKSGKKPNDIPSSPDAEYKNKGWISWGDFLGNNNIQPQKKPFLSFEEARQFVRSLKLKNGTEWREYRKSGEKPDNIPSSPDNKYKKEWISWGDWLGTGRIGIKSRVNLKPSRAGNKKRSFLNFKEAQQFVRSLNLKNQNDWQIYSKSDQRPADIPSTPNSFYKKKWRGWGNFLGTGTIAAQNKKYWSFEKARDYACKLGIASGNEWITLFKKSKIPKKIPRDVAHVYKNKGWISWGDFLGTGRIADQLKEYWSFEKARDYVRKINLKNREEWNTYCSSGKKPSDIPMAPAGRYQNQWKGWGDWLGTGTIANRFRKYQSFEQACDYTRKLGLKSRPKWYIYCNSGKKPSDIPTSPDKIYKKEWRGWGDWLGTGTISPEEKSKGYLPWKEAKLLYRKIKQENNLKNVEEWNEYVKTHKLPKGLPIYPRDIYTEERIRRMMK